MKKLRLFICFGVSFLIAAVGGSLTILDSWYYSLVQPSWKPPDFLFGPIWTTIFSLLAISAYLCWTKYGLVLEARRVLLVFFLNGLLNILWSYLYFFCQRPDWSLFEVVFLWLSILLLISRTQKLSNIASVLLTPYLAWVSLASLLNYQTVMLNGPF